MPTIRSTKDAWIRFCLILGVMAVGVLILSLLGVNKTGGTFVYPLDDTYIHLSLARNMLSSGEWGLNAGVPAFAASSPGYILLLTATLGIASWQGWPLLINILAGSSLSALLAFYPPFSSRSRTFPIILVLLLPLPLLVLSGMEHSLHILFAGLWFGRMFRPYKHTESSPVIYLVLGFLMTAFRYESLFLLAACIPFRLKRKYMPRVLMSTLGALGSVVLFGIWSSSQGGTFLPLPLIGKGHSPLLSPFSWLLHGITQLYENPFMWISVVLMMGIWLFTPKSNGYYTSAQGGTITLALLLHVFFAEIGGYRYEAYLLGLGGWVIWQVWEICKDKLKLYASPRSLGLFLMAGLFPFIIRAGFFYANAPIALQNIYEQPYQTALFLEAYYPSESVGMNDIGLGKWKSQIELTDMVGIGDQTVRDLRTRSLYTQANMDSLLLSREVSLIIGHETWIGPVIPDRMQAIARYCISDNFICADNCLTFWAEQGPQADSLSARLGRFPFPPNTELQILNPVGDSPD